MCEEGLEVLSELGAFAEQEVQSIWNDFIQGSPRWSFSRVWCLVVLGHWMKQNRIV
jgi:hypothetical protein